ncbi:general substrate transporter [Phialemonium atrogriseum]|uniref:General substrate transporter n=1 Tax=Phialemonium atrogriseum TaxID=1093897 RepID=A0AAJ0BXF4_9PEZI|nr:general substrate transporter [Phialemonium atrogriseum]KAK1764899.1 general substrate transporter [Phialemonium atrogriseum]
MAIAMGWHKPDNVAGSSAPAIMVGLFVATGGMLFGYDTGSINGILAMKSFVRQFTTGYIDPKTHEFAISPDEVSIIVAMLSAGTVLGALLAAPSGDTIGRRRSLIASVGVFCFGVIFQVCAHNIPLLLVGRFFAGVGVGTVSVLVPLYQSEMAPKWIRGTLVCAYQLSITVGLLSASIVNIITYEIDGSAAYRIPMGLQLTWACVLALGLLVLPETPRYLIKRGQKEAAALSLSRLRRLDITHPALVEELAEIEANHEYELALGPDTYKDIFFGSPHLGRRTLTGCGLQMLQQLTGVNFIMYYGTTFFNGANVSNPFQISVIMQVINTVSTIPGLLVVESWGRRNLLIIGAIGMAICQLLIASFTTAVGDSMPTTANKVLITFVAIYIFFFAASWGPVAWVVTSEIYPLKVRAKSMSISTASNWLLNFGIAYGTPYMVETGQGYADMGAKIFFVWGAFCIVAVFFVWCMIYETSKISLEQIDEMYERVDYAWNSKRFEPSWSFQQMRDFGYSDSGVQPQEQAHELQPARTSSTTTTSNSDTGVSGTSTSSQDDKVNPQMGNVDFSY